MQYWPFASQHFTCRLYGIRTISPYSVQIADSIEALRYFDLFIHLSRQMPDPTRNFLGRPGRCGSWHAPCCAVDGAIPQVIRRSMFGGPRNGVLRELATLNGPDQP